MALLFARIDSQNATQPETPNASGAAPPHPSFFHCPLRNLILRATRPGPAMHRPP
jgi:hypothetical protein